MSHPNRTEERKQAIGLADDYLAMASLPTYTELLAALRGLQAAHATLTNGHGDWPDVSAECAAKRLLARVGDAA
jgi:hypothetical protein